MRKAVLFTLQDKKSEVQGPEPIFSTSKVLGSMDRPHSLTCSKSAETKLIIYVKGISKVKMK